jgi:hypothetical protein
MTRTLHACARSHGMLRSVRMIESVATRPRRFLAQLVMFFGVALLAGESQAEVVRFQLSGHIAIDSAAGTLPDGIYEGAPFDAWLSYDPSTVDSFADDAHRGLYSVARSAGGSFELSAGSTRIVAQDVRLWVGNDILGNPAPGDGRVIWEIAGDNFQMLTSPVDANVAIAPFTSLGFSFRDPSQLAFASDQLPTQLSLEELADATIRFSALSTMANTNQFALRGVVTSLTLVPEPGSFVAASILAFSELLIGVGRRRRRYSRFSSSYVHGVQRCSRRSAGAMAAP